MGKYLSLHLKNLEQEEKAINYYLRHHDKGAYQKENSLINSPEYNELLSPYFKPITEELAKWMNEPYEKCEKYPERLIHRSLSGHYVRSKSEEMIDTELYRRGIPFRYECALELDEIVLYPDFTLRHPKTGKVIYWEHFGFMDDSNYCKNVFSKLQLYTSNGIIPTIQLITTFETKENPLHIGKIKEIIESYFM